MVEEALGLPEGLLSGFSLRQNSLSTDTGVTGFLRSLIGKMGRISV
jgi:hypothetical protein